MRKFRRASAEAEWGEFAGGTPAPPTSAMLGLEFAHVIDQRSHAFDRHRVVDRSAHSANRAVALQLDHSALYRALFEFVFERRIGKRERDVHARAVGLGDRTG